MLVVFLAIKMKFSPRIPVGYLLPTENQTDTLNDPMKCPTHSRL